MIKFLRRLFGLDHCLATEWRTVWTHHMTSEHKFSPPAGWRVFAVFAEPDDTGSTGSIVLRFVLYKIP